MWAPGMRTIYFSEWVMLKLVQDRWTKTVEKKKLGLVLAVKRCGILRSREKEGTYTLCNSMDGTGEPYAKWNKPVSEGQLPYDLTYKWNLINKTNKQAKYNQRHWHKE